MAYNNGVNGNPSPLERLWNQMSLTSSGLYDSASKSAFIAGAGGALYSASSSLAWGILGHAAGLVTSTLAVNLMSSHKISILQDAKIRLCEQFERHPLLPVISFIFAVAVGTISPELGFFLAALFSFARGLIVQELQQRAQLSTVDKSSAAAAAGAASI